MWPFKLSFAALLLPLKIDNLKQGWCGKNYTGKYRMVFTGFYHQINPKSEKYWEIRF
jgi:hypothetical protein